MVERIKHIPSTVIAVLITLAALALVFTGKADLTEVGIAIPAIIVALRYKPKEQNKEDEKV
jgi:hypothetical protein